MAKLPFTLAALFFLFAVVYGRSPSDFPDKTVADRDGLTSLPESDSNPTLLLPSEKAEPKPLTVVDSELETAESKSIDAGPGAKTVGTTEDLPVDQTRTVYVVPQNRPFVRFQPINRHFPFRMPFRGCGHGIKHKMKSPIHRREVSYGDDMILAGEIKDSEHDMKPMMKVPIYDREVSYGDDMLPAEDIKVSNSEMMKPIQGHEASYGDDMLPAGESKFSDREMKPPVHRRGVSYGDDMILAGDRKDFDPDMFLGGVREMPEQWMRFHHHHHHHRHPHHHHEGMPEFPFSRHHAMFATNQRFRRPFHGEREEGGFMDRIRKFLHGF
ncbi:hypothetical protein U1Q18_019747 [Sarracenia purpurea var. burkii]